MELRASCAFFLIAHVNCYITQLENYISSSISLTQCVINASLKYFDQNDLIIVSMSPLDIQPDPDRKTASFNEFLLLELFQQNKWSFLLRKPDSCPPYKIFLKKSDVYMILLREEEELEMHLQKMRMYNSWNPHAELLVISNSLFENNTISAARMIITLKEYKIYKGVVILPTNRDPETHEIYTWSPFSAENCGDKLHKLKIIDSCKNGVFKTNINWFGGKIPNNLNGCKIKVMTVVWPPYVMAPVKKIAGTVDEYDFQDGIEIKTMNTVAEVANLTVVYRKSDLEQHWGHIYGNASCSGIFCELLNETIDVGLSSLAATEERHIYFDYISSLLLESLKFCVPHSLRIPQWKNITSVLKFEVMAATSFLTVLLILLIWALGKLKHSESASYKFPSRILLNLHSTFLGVPVYTLPKSNMIRFLFIMWIFVGLHLNTAYQTNLISILTGPSFEPQMSTVDELLKSDLTIYFLSNSARYFKQQHAKSLQQLVSRWTNCNAIKSCLYDVAFARTAAMCAPMNYIQYAMNRYTAKNGDSLIYCFKRAVTTYPTEFLTRKGFPLKERIATIVQRINAAGLPQMWLKNLFKAQMKTQGHEVESLGADRHTTITLDHFQAIFMFYFIAIGVACIIFVLEIYIHRYKMRGSNAKRLRK